MLQENGKISPWQWKKCNPVQNLSLGNKAPSLAQLQGSAMDHATQKYS